jgi:hypothetical protein
MSTTSIKYIEGLIGDPEQYLEQNPDSLENIHGRESAILSGQDWDVLIQQTGDADAFTRRDEHPTPLLGTLYRATRVSNFILGDFSYRLQCYPSPYYVNNVLLPVLGIQPGVDVFAFAHTPQGQDKVDPSDFSRYFLDNCEYPQSLGSAFFEHDRRAPGHALGVITMPKVITRGIIETGQDPVIIKRMQKDFLWEKRHVVPNALDGITSLISGNAESESMSSMSCGFEWYRHLMPELEIMSQESGKRADACFIDLVKGHVTELRPKIAAAQASMPPTVTAVT